MNIVQPYAKIVDVPHRYAGIQLLQTCEMAARISHRSEDATKEGSWDRFIRFVVMEKGDFSVIEHRVVTVEFLVDRGITHEIVRHRLASFTQESTRFVNYEKKMPPSFISPMEKPEPAYISCSLPIDQCTYPNCGGSTAGCPTKEQANNIRAYNAWEAAIKQSEFCYREMLAAGCSPQIARSVFPNALASKIWMTCNLRQWRHFFLMRTSAEAHPQMRQVTIPLLAEFQEKIPILYEDIQPGSKQSDNMKKMR